MPALYTSQLSYQLDSGEWLLNELNFSLNERVTGLVGRNGVGKSLFISLLLGRLTPAKGRVCQQGNIAYYSQLPSELMEGDITIAEHLGIADKLSALEAISQGSVLTKDFDTVGDDWEVEKRYTQHLANMNITANLNQACRLLSGGQLALLQLHSLFCSDASILLLDEPSNHLDLKGKQWLIEKINNFEGKVLLVSHDRFLLENVDAIYQLTGLGLNYFEGNYSQFMEQSQRIEQALDRRIDALKLEKRKIERQEQINKERMEQRASQGNKMRKNGSQPKILLDAMKNSAEQSQASSVKNKNNQKARNSEKLVTLSRQKEALKSQAIYMPDGDASKRTVLLTIDNAHLSFGCKQSIWLKLTQGERLHLQGGNGSGKSTLLKAIHDQPLHQKGPIVKRSESVYLDQHFGLLNSGMNLLDSLRTSCAGLVESEARTLLAGIGFRRDTVYRQIACLSGGEKMKLAMLMVSHKKEAPILLLDEPDNHLDIESKERLSQALKHYKGAFILVSHDDYFVQSLGVNNTLSLCS